MTDAAAAMTDVEAKADTVATTKRPTVIRASDVATMDAGNPLAEEITSVMLQVRHHHHLRLGDVEEDPEAKKARDLARERTTTKLVQVNLCQAITQCCQARTPCR